MMGVEYWNNRYRTGIGAGEGSKGRLLGFKIRIVQEVIDTYEAKSVVDLGCGSGALAKGLKIENKYVGLDISDVAIAIADKTAQSNHAFHVYNPEELYYAERTFDVALSLDVIIHIGGADRETHLNHLFAMAEKAVIIYGVNDAPAGISLASHMHYEEFVPYVEEHFPEWSLAECIPNDYPVGTMTGNGSYSNFFIYERS